jgi:hypothetical protein
MASAQGNVWAPPGTFPTFGLDLQSAHTWAWIFFAGAVAWLFSMYALHGGRRGGVV